MRINHASKIRVMLALLALMGPLIASSIVPPTKAYAVGSYNNAEIADKALGYLGKWGGNACADAKKTQSGQCKQFANCIVYMVSGNKQYPVDPNGNYQNSYSGAGGVEITSTDSVAKGDIVQYGSTDADGAAGKLHTAIVVENKSGGKFSVVDSNFNYDETVTQHDYTPPSGARFWRMGTASSTNSGGGSAPSTPQILAVKRTTDPGGTRQVYAATKAAVTEAYWAPGGDGVHTSEIIHIAQNNIVGFDKVNLPSGGQTVYTAVPDGVWETYWGAGASLSSSKIVTGMTGVRQVIADNRYESGQFVHRLYVLAEDGPHEIWWKDGGDGVHNNLLDSIAGPVTMTSSTGPDGSYQLYVATPTYVYELWWFPGGAMHHGSVMRISQGDIRSLSKGANLPDGGQLLYTGTSTTAWQSYWNSGTGVSHGTIAQSQTNAIQIKKTVYDGVHQLYLATGDHVQEYWWSGSGSGTSTLVVIMQNNIKAFDKYNDGNVQQVYTASGDIVWETWWRSGVGPTTSILFHVAR